MIVFVVLALLVGIAGFVAGRVTAESDWPGLSALERFSGREEDGDEDFIVSAEFAERVQGYADPS